MNAEQAAEEPPRKVPRIEQQEKPQIIGKVDRNDEEISVSNWLIEMLTRIERIEMANSGLTTSSWVFEQLCGPKLHGQVEPHAVGHLDLAGEQDSVAGDMRGVAHYGNKLLPLPSTPPPDYITGFEHISIHYLDDRVLEFVKCIASKLDGIKFVMEMNFEGWIWSVRDERSRAIQCLLNALAGRIDQFHFERDSNFKIFNWHFRHFINHCQCIRICGELSPRFKKPEFNVLFKWLTNRRQMDPKKQKVLMFPPWFAIDYFFGRIKEEFTNATDPLNFFIIYFGSALPEYNLDLENENTGEKMISYENAEFRGRLILRCPKGQEEQWKEEGGQKIKAFSSNDMTEVELDIEDFGTFIDVVA